MCKSVLCEKRHEKLNQVCKQKQCLLLNCCNIFDLLASRTEKIAWWHLFLNLIFTYFPIMNKSGKFIVKFFLYHTYLKASQKLRNYSQIIRFFQRKMNIFIVKNFRQPLKCKLSIIYTAFASLFLYRYTLLTQPVFTCSKSTMETPEQFVNSIQS